MELRSVAVESARLRTHGVMVVMDQFTRRIAVTTSSAITAILPPSSSSQTNTFIQHILAPSGELCRRPLFDVSS